MSLLQTLLSCNYIVEGIGKDVDVDHEDRQDRDSLKSSARHWVL